MRLDVDGGERREEKLGARLALNALWWSRGYGKPIGPGADAALSRLASFDRARLTPWLYSNELQGWVRQRDGGA